MTILEQINADFQQAYKARQTALVSTLRVLLAALKNERINKRVDLVDEDVMKVVKSEIKKRKESIEEFTKGQRQDLVDKEAAELIILAKYLPAQLSEEEVRQKVKAILATIADQDNLGKVIGQVMKELKNAADGNLIRKIVEEENKK